MTAFNSPRSKYLNTRQSNSGIPAPMLRKVQQTNADDQSSSSSAGPLTELPVHKQISRICPRKKIKITKGGVPSSSSDDHDGHDEDDGDIFETDVIPASETPRLMEEMTKFRLRKTNIPRSPGGTTLIPQRRSSVRTWNDHIGQSLRRKFSQAYPNSPGTEVDNGTDAP
ncbi:hypothetical protein HK102_007656 [Quaeritorhiza haematococci]|nr:hypothetical protein HK102_007656 [Quaeritorhiza haematococci]